MGPLDARESAAARENGRQIGRAPAELDAGEPHDAYASFGEGLYETDDTGPFDAESRDVDDDRFVAEESRSAMSAQPLDPFGERRFGLERQNGERPASKADMAGGGFRHDGPA